MLEKLLAEIRESNTTSPTLLAEKLNTSRAMVEAMLDTLEEQGYLQTIDLGCADETACGDCALAGMCSSRKGKIRAVRAESGE